MKKLDGKALYKKVRDHLLKQGEKSLLPGFDGACAYRSEEGLKCAAGCLIADKHYRKTFETNVACTALVWKAIVASGVKDTDANMDLVMGLQGIHDDVPPSRWRSALNSFAKEFFA